VRVARRASSAQRDQVVLLIVVRTTLKTQFPHLPPFELFGVSGPRPDGPGIACNAHGARDVFLRDRGIDRAGRASVIGDVVLLRPASSGQGQGRKKYGRASVWRPGTQCGGENVGLAAASPDIAGRAVARLMPASFAQALRGRGGATIPAPAVKTPRTPSARFPLNALPPTPATRRRDADSSSQRRSTPTVRGEASL